MSNSKKQYGDEAGVSYEKLAELKELRKKEAHFRLLVEATSDWIWEVSAEGVYTYSSPQVESILGYTPEYVIGKTPFDMMPPSEAERIEAVFRNLTEKNEPIVELENFAFHKDGRMVVLETSGVPFFDQNGKLEGYRGIDRDITSRKRAETALAREKRFSDAMLDGLPGIFYVFDGKGRFLRWNRNVETISGYTANEISQMTSDLFFPEAERPAVREAIGRVFTEGWATIEANFLSKDGSTAPYLMTGTRIDIEGNPLLAGLGMDITERKQAEREKLILERQVQHAQKLESIGVLTAGIAHEINNPLAGILQSVSVLINRLTGDLPANDKAAKASGTSISAIRQYLELRKIPGMLENIRNSGNMAAKIVKNMLNFSRKSEKVISSHNLGGLMDQALELFQTNYDMKKGYDFKKIEIVRDYDHAVCPVPCEASKIQQVFMNILKNGAEAMTEAKNRSTQPTFMLSVRDDDAWVRVEIEDNGPGMDSTTRRRVFEPLYTTKSAGKGTGLGLSVSYYIITNDHDGEISVEDSKSGGTRFVIRLPKGGKR